MNFLIYPFNFPVSSAANRDLKIAIYGKRFVLNQNNEA
jgi:hypothetical protein